jgi:hypothetical protein
MLEEYPRWKNAIISNDPICATKRQGSNIVVAAKRCGQTFATVCKEMEKEAGE